MCAQRRLSAVDGREVPAEQTNIPFRNEEADGVAVGWHSNKPCRNSGGQSWMAEDVHRRRACTVGVRALSACVHWSQLWRALSAAHTGTFSDTNALRALPMSGRHIGTDAVVL